MLPRISAEYVAWGCSSSSSESEELKWVTSWRKGARFQYVYYVYITANLKSASILQQLYGYIYVEYPSQFVSWPVILDIFGICTLHAQLIQESKKSSAPTQGGATKTHKDFQQCIGFFE